MCRLFHKSKPLPTGFPIYTMPYADLIKELQLRGIEWMCKPQFRPDREVRYTDLNSWNLIAPHLVSPADKYISEGCDCDDYAKMASAKCAFDFGLNGCLEAFGTIPMGSHAFNLLVSLEDFFIVETNAGFPVAGTVLELGEHDYIATSWK